MQDRRAERKASEIIPDFGENAREAAGRSTVPPERRQFEMMAHQTELAASAQRMATESTRPLTSVFGGQAGPMS